MRYQRLGIVGLGLLSVLGAAAAFRSTCGDCEGQNISAIGERHPDEQAYEDAFNEFQPALVVDGALDGGSGDNDPLTLFGDDGTQDSDTPGGSCPR